MSLRTALRSLSSTRPDAQALYSRALEVAFAPSFRGQRASVDAFVDLAERAKSRFSPRPFNSPPDLELFNHIGKSLAEIEAQLRRYPSEGVNLERDGLRLQHRNLKSHERGIRSNLVAVENLIGQAPRIGEAIAPSEPDLQHRFGLAVETLKTLVGELRLRVSTLDAAYAAHDRQAIDQLESIID